MRIAVTGPDGQLGQAFREVAAGHEIVPLSRRPGAANPFDLADPAQAGKAIAAARPDWVLHAGALTDVDACERDPALAHRVNALGTQAVAAAAHACGARLIAVSTDYVFDGRRGSYREGDPTGPINAYGRSKLEGERMAAAAAPDSIVARTSVVFGPHKKNFVLWLLGELRAGRPVRIVEDQRVTPTLSHDLAEQCLALMEADAPPGIVHTAGATAHSRLEMARLAAAAFGLPQDLVVPIRSSDLSWLAARPMDATLNTAKVSAVHAPMTYPDALRRLKGMLP